MVQVKVYNGGNVQRQGTSDARVRPSDFGQSGLGAGLQQAGKVLNEVVEVRDQIEDIHDKQEADRLSLELTNFRRDQRRLVRETKGEAAQKVAADARNALQQRSQELYATARSPRARQYLEREVEKDNAVEIDNWETYGHGQFVADRTATLTAKSALAAEEAAEADDDDLATQGIGRAVEAARERLQFEGKTGEEALAVERLKISSRVWLTRARNLALAEDDEGALALLDARQGEIIDEEAFTLRDAIKKNLDLNIQEQDAYFLESGARVSTAPPSGDLGEETFHPPVRAKTTTIPGGQYGAPRSYGTHRAVDLAGAPGTPVYPMRTGTLKKYRTEGGGNTVEVAMSGGWKMKVLHLKDGSTDHLQSGQEVGPNDVIGGIGNTGSASRGNHAHVELYDPKGNKVDYRKWLGNAVRSSSPPPAPTGSRVDIAAAEDRARQMVADGTWTESRARRALEGLRRRATVNDQIKSRAEEDAGDRIADQLAAMVKAGKKPTSSAVFDQGAWSRMSSEQRLQYENMFAQNREPKEPQGDEKNPVYHTLKTMALLDGARFLRTFDPNVHGNQLTPSQLRGLLGDQQEIANRANVQPGQVMAVVNSIMGADPILKKNSKKYPVNRLIIVQAVQDRIRREMQGQKVTQDDILRIAQSEATFVNVNGKPTTFAEGRRSGAASFEVNIPASVQEAVNRVAAKEGIPASVAYVRYRGTLW